MALQKKVVKTSVAAIKVAETREVVRTNARGCLVFIERFMEKIVAKELLLTYMHACKLNCSTICSILQHLFLD